MTEKSGETARIAEIRNNPFLDVSDEDIIGALRDQAPHEKTPNARWLLLELADRLERLLSRLSASPLPPQRGPFSLIRDGSASPADVGPDKYQFATDVMLDRRNLLDTNVCQACDGWGVQTYGNTSTWRRSIGGNVLTTGVCDRCWGSGNADHPWPSWRKQAADVGPQAQGITTPTMADAAEMLWVVLANVSGGDWTLQTAEWQEAAARWRDYYFAAVKASGTVSQAQEKE